MNLMTSDENPAYEEAIVKAYGEVEPPRPGRRGRPAKPKKILPAGVTYATVHKTRENNRVVKVEARLIFGTLLALTLALASSTVSEKVNTVYIERQNGTDRNRNGVSVRPTAWLLGQPAARLGTDRDMAGWDQDGDSPGVAVGAGAGGAAVAAWLASLAASQR